MVTAPRAKPAPARSQGCPLRVFVRARHETPGGTHGAQRRGVAGFSGTTSPEMPSPELPESATPQPSGGSMTAQSLPSSLWLASAKTEVPA